MKKKIPFILSFLTLAVIFTGCFGMEDIFSSEIENESESVIVSESIPVTDTETAQEGAYGVLVVDENESPVSGVTVQFCTDNECNIGKTGNNGIAEFATGEPGEYKVSVLQVPEGYTKDENEYITENDFGQIKIVLKRSEEKTVVTGPVPIEDAEGLTMSFDAVDFDGNETDIEDMFSGHDVTMVNLWATWCHYCVEEFPYLEEYNKELEKNGCQIIGICEDGNYEPELAAYLLNDAGVTYPNFVVKDGFESAFETTVFPITYFVDSNGTILTEPVMGADFRGYQAAIEEALEKVRGD